MANKCMYANRVTRYNLLRQLYLCSAYVPFMSEKKCRIYTDKMAYIELNPRLEHNYRSTLTYMKFCPSRGRKVRIREKRSERGRGQPARTLYQTVCNSHITGVCGNCTVGLSAKFQSKCVLESNYRNHVQEKLNCYRDTLIVSLKQIQVSTY